jgi:hypothetical protein
VTAVIFIYFSCSSEFIFKRGFMTSSNSITVCFPVPQVSASSFYLYVRVSMQEGTNCSMLALPWSRLSAARRISLHGSPTSSPLDARSQIRGSDGPSASYFRLLLPLLLFIYLLLNKREPACKDSRHTQQCRRWRTRRPSP